MEELNPLIVQGFGMKLKNYTQVRSVFMCQTDQGMKAVKRIEVEIGRILFQHSAKEHLCQNGFQKMDRFFISGQNTPYYIFNGNIYTMVNWLPGRECDFYNPVELKAAITELAHMHKASAGFQPMEGSIIQSTIGQLTHIFAKRTSEMIRIRKWIHQQSRLTDFDILFLKNYEYYYELSCEAAELISGAIYKQVVDEAIRRKVFCHNEYTHHNVIYHEKGQVQVIHFEACAYDTPMQDVSDVLSRYMRMHQWDIQKAYEALYSYDKINPIRKEEMAVLLSTWIYPLKFLKICNQYYNSKRKRSTGALKNKLQEIIEQQYLHNIFIREFKKLL